MPDSVNEAQILPKMKGPFTPNDIYENFTVGTSASHLCVYKVVKSDMVLFVDSSI